MKNILMQVIISIFGLSVFSQTKIELVKEFDSTEGTHISNFIKHNGRLMFFVENTDKIQLWSSDGSQKGTILENIINPNGKLNFNPSPITINENLYFLEHNETGETIVWMRKKGENNLTRISLTNQSIKINSKLQPATNEQFYFSTIDQHKNQLWVSNGTKEGTKLLKDINPNLTFLTELNRKVYFSANDGNGDQPWVSDGTPTGTMVLKMIEESPGAQPIGLTAYNNKLVFTAYNMEYEYGYGPLWISDGTSEGTKIIKDIIVNGWSFVQLHDKLYFTASEKNDHLQLWVTDGTTKGTKLVKTINPNGSSNAMGFTEFNGKLYFSADDGKGSQLWVTDGTTEGTTLLKTIKSDGNSDPQSFSQLGSKLYFIARSNKSGIQLFETDGTEKGTKLISPVNPLAHECCLPNKDQLFYFNNALYFSADYGNGIHLYKITN